MAERSATSAGSRRRAVRPAPSAGPLELDGWRSDPELEAALVRPGSPSLPETRGSGPGELSEELEPSGEELTVSIRILLHILRQGRYGPDEVPPPSLTQAGIVSATCASQGAVSRTLTLLIDGGAVESRREHVRGRNLRVLVYRLTRRGEEIAVRLRIRFPAAGGFGR